MRLLTHGITKFLIVCCGLNSHRFALAPSRCVLRCNLVGRMEHCTMLASAAAQQGQRRGSNVRRIEQDVKHIQPARARSWLFSPATLDRSPSRIDGLSEAEERRQRRSGCAHIQAIIRGVLEEPLRHAKLSDPTLASEAALERLAYSFMFSCMQRSVCSPALCIAAVRCERPLQRPWFFSTGFTLGIALPDMIAS